MRSPSIRMPWSAFGASDTPSMRRPARTRVRWGGAGWAAMPDPGSATATARPRARRVRHERGDIIPPGVSWEVRNVRRPILSAGLLVRQRARFRSLIVLALACWPAVMPAQAEPHRPALRAAADTNDWEACFDAGVAKLRREPAEAEAAFYWASRLAPRRAQPLYGRWGAVWMRDRDRWIDYLLERRDVLRKPEVIRADSLRYRAYLRNPFVHQGLSVLLFDQLPGEWRTDPATRGMIAYAAADFPTAVDLFARALARDSVKQRWVRSVRASALVSLGRLDEALAEMNALLRALRKED